jgi:hypothetical protein
MTVATILLTDLLDRLLLNYIRNLKTGLISSSKTGCRSNSEISFIQNSGYPPTTIQEPNMALHGSAFTSAYKFFK